MESATMRKWLAKRGCQFSDSESHRGRGIAAVTVHRGERVALLPLIGSRKRLEPQVVQQIVEALGLKVADLPGSKGRIHKRRATRT